jgi:hypothetical protein
MNERTFLIVILKRISVSYLPGAVKPEQQLIPGIVAGL